jgi:8-oxo-dGTP diphosphatase
MRGEPHRQKSLLYEGKGIVEKPDKLGRRNCYDDQTGKRVPCPKKDEPKKEKPQTKPTKESVDTGETPTKEESPVIDATWPFEHQVQQQLNIDRMRRNLQIWDDEVRRGDSDARYYRDRVADALKEAELDFGAPDSIGLSRIPNRGDVVNGWSVDEVILPQQGGRSGMVIATNDAMDETREFSPAEWLEMTTSREQESESREPTTEKIRSEIERLEAAVESAKKRGSSLSVRRALEDTLERTKQELAEAQQGETREPTPEEVRKVHNPETGRKSAVDAIRDVNSGTMYGKIMRDELITEQELERASRRVHDAWMQREASLPGGGRASRRHLMVPYEQLSEADKEKDREFVREVVASMRPEKYWGSKQQPFYRPGPNPTVDNVVMRDGESGPEVLLIRRKDGTAEGGKWALPGGFIDSDSKKGEPFKPGKETPEQAALRELTEESGLDLQSIQDQVKKVGTFDTRGRDPRDNAEAWAVSDAFSVKLPKDMADAYVQGRDDADRAEWVPVSELKNRELAFDHASILNASGVETPPEPGFTGTDRLGREWRDGELIVKQEEPVTDEEGYSQVDDATGKRRTPEEQQQYRRDIEEMNRQPREIAKEAISGWDSFTTNEKRDLMNVIERYMETTARVKAEDDVGGELTDEEVEEIKSEVFRRSSSLRPREVQKLIREISDPGKAGISAYREFKAALRKIRDSRAGTQQQEPSKETPKTTQKVSDDVHKEITRQFEFSGFPAIVTNVPEGASVGYPGAHEVDLSEASTRSDVIDLFDDAVAASDGEVLSISLPKGQEAQTALARLIKNAAEDGVKVIVHSPDDSAGELLLLNRDLMGRSRTIKAGPDKPKTPTRGKPKVKPSPFKGRKKPR